MTTRPPEKLDRQKGYWSFFNFATRFVGVCFVLVGGICFYYAHLQGDILAMVMTAVVSVLGILLNLAKPYRPDLGGQGPSKPPSHTDLE